MVRGTVTVSSSANRFAEIQRQIAALAKKEVLVGVPEDTTARQNGDNINNAELLYIQTHGVRKKEMRSEMQQSINGGMRYSDAHSLYLQEHGSPLWQVPPRPVLEPAIEDNKEAIGKQLGKITKAALGNNPVCVEAEMNQAGLDAVRYTHDWFDNPKNGWPENSEKTIKMKGSNLPLVDTNQMRKAITYVVRDK